jgi:hypothetical protein
MLAMNNPAINMYLLDMALFVWDVICISKTETAKSRIYSLKSNGCSQMVTRHMKRCQIN